MMVSLDCTSFYAVPNSGSACMSCRWSRIEMNCITVADKQKGLLVSQVDTTARKLTIHFQGYLPQSQVLLGQVCQELYSLRTFLQ